MTTYDMSIHTNPDARAWAKFFCEKYKVWSDDGVEIDSEELMIAWFANAMMAMHDHLTAERDLLLEQMRSDRKQYLDMRDERNALKEACATHANTAPAQQLTDDHRQTIYANQCLVAALDRIHDVLNGVYVDDVAGIVNRAIAENGGLK